jgi:chromosome segregation ATPase
LGQSSSVIADLEGQVTILRRTAEDSKAEVQRLQMQLQEKNFSEESLVQELQRIQHEQASLASDLHRQLRENQASSENSASLRELVNSCESKIRTLEGENISLERRVSGLLQRLAATVQVGCHEFCRDEFESVLQMVLAKIEELHAAKARLERDLEAKAGELARTRQQLLGKEEENRGLQLRISELQSLEFGLKEEVARLKQFNQTMVQEFEV